MPVVRVTYTEQEKLVLNALADLAEEFRRQYDANPEDQAIRKDDAMDVEALHDGFGLDKDMFSLVTRLEMMDTEVRDWVYNALVNAVGQEPLEAAGVVFIHPEENYDNIVSIREAMMWDRGQRLIE